MRTTALQVRRFRLRRQHLADRDGEGPVAIARRLLGVQAQVPSAAAQAVASRTATGRADDGTVDAALAAGTLVRTWSARGTLHLLAADQAPALLALLAAARTWDKGSWQREFATAEQMRALEAAVVEVLADGAVLTREELTAALVAHSGHTDLSAALGSGWGAVLKPLAWQGLLCHGPPTGTRVTFTSPRTAVRDWPGLPDPDDAARTVVPAFLAAHGPATPTAFDAWLLRGGTPKARLRRWFADLVADGTLTEVTVDGGTRHARTADLDDLDGAGPVDRRLLGPFDPYVLGAGTADPDLVPPGHRREVSRAAGWIAPVVVDDGRVVATWSADDGRLAVTPFEDPVAVPEAERATWSRVLGRELTAPA
ncbi:winged helix DNA-binding domain-containing protein [Actinomycetospora lemnae]|uniref:Winged helix DNA-binding domain-containing protein n=1 Tax=Actinomycetospora lemnae TaxID=3019891 RepID=A0ABT5SQB9_9PSEU|nr:winged helix DNA-binding domain-containing protein [Actinomycetospora sp. DW7H6]MDD7965040.1 winged helix DNA-binding domain-containing protein [Actinomycetospora sp. DW7H6]